ncbi:MAG TPA: hypothetical protein VFO52_15780 [Longimicrobiales bacterium]|nr:hypothetical protein [Longimicrobiales bacterium]
MRLGKLLVMSLFTVTPLMAQEKAAAPAASLPAGWSARLDKENATSAPKFVAMGDGFHATTGPAAIFWNAEHNMTGDFRISATFTQTKAPTHPEAYGLFVGGKNLDKENVDYGYLVVRGDGKYMIKHRAGTEVHTIQDWTEHPKLNKQDAAGKATNTLAIELSGDQVKMLVNGEEVKRWERSYWNAIGQAGLRINHNLDVHVSDFKVEPIKK